MPFGIHTPFPDLIVACSLKWQNATKQMSIKSVGTVVIFFTCQALFLSVVSVSTNAHFKRDPASVSESGRRLFLVKDTADKCSSPWADS